MSIADELRADQHARLKRLTVEQRVALAFELGRRDLALYAAKQALPLAEARRRLTTRRAIGRVPSCSSET